ncbi:MAG: hypothetical protein HY335_00245 [Deinococcus sp.]|nr:hypothetical protein [Deinococcus sp.]
MEKRFVLVWLLLSLALAQEGEVENRILRVQAGIQIQVSVSEGPAAFYSLEPDGVVITIENTRTRITANRALILAAPGQRFEEGSRLARIGRLSLEDIQPIADNVDGLFITQRDVENLSPEGAVDVSLVRDRLTATGPLLDYSEATGEGVLYGPVQAVQTPREGEEPLLIQSERIEFDVDEEFTVAMGDVRFAQGRVSGESERAEVTQGTDVAVLDGTEQERIAVARSSSDPEEEPLRLAADQLRIRTDVRVTLALGAPGRRASFDDNGTTGEAESIEFDDTTGVAILRCEVDPCMASSPESGTVQALEILYDSENDILIAQGRTRSQFSFGLEGEER